MKTCPRCGFDPSLPMTFQEGVGIRVRGARIAKGMTQDDLSHALGINPKTVRVSRLESGNYANDSFGLKFLRKVAAALDVSVRDLIPDTAPESGGIS